jgi:hypothetical protein
MSRGSHVEVEIQIWADVPPRDPAESCPHAEPTSHLSPSTPDHPRPSPCRTSRLARNGMSSHRCCSKRDRPPYAKLHPAHATGHLIELLDTNHVQILGPQTYSLQDKKAPKVRREESFQIRRHNARILTTAAIEEPRRGHCVLHIEDVRS